MDEHHKNFFRNEDSDSNKNSIVNSEIFLLDLGEFDGPIDLF